MKVIAFLIFNFLKQCAGLNGDILPCLTNELNNTNLRLILRTRDFSTPLRFYDPYGFEKGFCDFNTTCKNIDYDNLTNEVVLDLQKDDIQQGTWSCNQGSRRLTTNVSVMGDILSSTTVKIKGSKTEYNNVSYVEITCSSCRKPYHLSVEFYVNNKSGHVLTFHEHSKTCYRNYKICSREICFCSARGNEFSHYYTVRNSSIMTFSCVMKFISEKQDFQKVSYLLYDGMESFKFLGIRTNVEVNEIDDDTNPELKENIERLVGVVIGCIGLMVVCIGFIYWKCQRKKQNKDVVDESTCLLQDDEYWNTDDRKRYLVTQYLLQKYVLPVLREYMKNELQNLFMYWKSDVKIDKQSYCSHVIIYKQKDLKLNYSSINNNSGKIEMLRDYNVRTVHEFSKLFLSSSFASYDDSKIFCDIEALIELIITIEEFDPLVKEQVVQLKYSVIKVCKRNHILSKENFQRAVEIMKRCISLLNMKVDDSSSPTNGFENWADYGISTITEGLLKKTSDIVCKLKFGWQPKIEEVWSQTVKETFVQEMDRLEEILDLQINVGTARIKYGQFQKRLEVLKMETGSLNYEHGVSWNIKTRDCFDRDFNGLYEKQRGLMEDMEHLLNQLGDSIANEMLEVISHVSGLVAECKMLSEVLKIVQQMTPLAVKNIGLFKRESVDQPVIKTFSQKNAELNDRKCDIETIGQLVLRLERETSQVYQSVVEQWKSILEFLKRRLLESEETFYLQKKTAYWVKQVNLRTREVTYVECFSKDAILERPNLSLEENERLNALEQEFLNIKHESFISMDKQERHQFFSAFKQKIERMADPQEDFASCQEFGTKCEMFLTTLRVVESMSYFASGIKTFVENIETLLKLENTQEAIKKKLDNVQLKRKHCAFIAEQVVSLYQESSTDKVKEHAAKSWGSISVSLKDDLINIEDSLMKRFKLTRVINMRSGEVSFQYQQLTKDENNFIRVCLLVFNIGPGAVRAYFDKVFPPSNLHQTLFQQKTWLNLLKRKRIVTTQQWDLLFPEKGLPQSSNFDLQLMCRLLLNTSPSTIPAVRLSPMDLTPGADLQRIIFFRNKIAHALTPSLTDIDMDEILQELKPAIGRLGGPKFEQKVEEILGKESMDTVHIDESLRREMYHDLDRKFKKLHEAYDQLVNEYVNDTVHNDENWKRLAVNKGEAMQLKRDDLQTVLRHEDVSFIETKAATKLSEKIKFGNVRYVAVTGEAGIGKSFTVRHVGLQLEKVGFEIYNVKESDTIVRNELSKYKETSKSNKRLYVFDDFCGVNMTRMTDVKTLDSAIDFVKMLSNDDVVICIICPLRVFRDKEFDSIRNIFMEFNFSSGELELTKAEKALFAKSFLKVEDCESVPDAFYTTKHLPLLCEIYQKDPLINMKRLFENHISVYEKGVKALLENDFNGYCTLALCVLLNNEMDEEFFSKNGSRVPKLLVAICKASNKPTGVVDFTDILKKCESLPILQNVAGVYKTIHDTIFDFLCIFFGQKITECIIKNASSKFLMERIYTESNDDHTQNSSLIYIQEDKHRTIYIERIITDWLLGKLQQVFGSVNMKIPKFRKTFLSYITKLDLTKQIDLKQSIDVETNRSVLFYSRRIKDHGFISWFLTTTHTDKTSSRSENLYFSCRNGNTNNVKTLLDTEDLTSLPAYRYLFIASQKGHYEIVNLLLNRNIDPNEQDENGISPLYAACHGGHIDVVQALLSKNANVNMNSIQSPLYIACKNDYNEIAKALLQQNADVNYVTENGKTPLYIACEKGNIEIVELLLKNSQNQTTEKVFAKDQVNEASNVEKNTQSDTLNIDIKTSDGLTPLFIACLKNHADIAKLLIKYGADTNIGQNVKGAKTITPLFAACQEGKTEIVKELLVGNTEINKSSCNKTPLYIACEKNFLGIVELLLKKKANVEKGNTEQFIVWKQDEKGNIESQYTQKCSTVENGQTPLYIASLYGHYDIVKLLLENNAKITRNPVNGLTALHVVCRNGFSDIFELLVEKGADIRDTGELFSPLALACYCGHVGIVKSILQKGISCNVFSPNDEWNQSPLYLATIRNKWSVVQTLVNYGSDIELKLGDSGKTCFHKASELGFWKIVQIFLKNGVQVNMQTKLGATALYIASENGQTEVAKKLIDWGANVNLRTNFGFTPLYIACLTNNIEIVTLLLSNKGDLNNSWQENLSEYSNKALDTEESNIMTPLHVACKMNFPEIVDLLLQNNAKIDITFRSSGASPLFIACQYGHVEIAENILKDNEAQIGVIKSALEKALDEKQRERLQLRLEMKKMVVNQMTDTGGTPLFIACERGYSDIVRLLLNYKAEVNEYQTNTLYLPLHIACEKGFSEITKMLLDKNAKLDEQTASRATPIFIASQYGKIDIVKLLLHKGANVKINDFYGRSPIQVAEEKGFKDVVLLLKDCK